MGWSIYIQESINYPFEAEYEEYSRTKGKQWKKVKVVGSMTDEDDFNWEEYYVEVELDDLIIPAKLGNLRNIKADEKTMKTLQVWNYRWGY